jgi:phosphate butyryltransferase
LFGLSIYLNLIRRGIKMIKDFTQLLKQAQLIGPKKVSVAVAQDIEVLTAIKKAKELDIAEPILVGDKDKICAIAQEIDLSLENVDIVDERIWL